MDFWRQVCPRNRYFLAPMAGITDSAFRTVCAGQGAGLTYTEMVSAKALTYGDKKTRTLLSIVEDHRPCGAQIFGSEPAVMAQGARIALELSGAEFIDINMGCPVPKIVGNGEGSALMRTPALAGEIVAAVKAAVPVPVTVKFRRGFDGEHLNAVEFARVCEQAGADAMTVHGRTRQQFYTGLSDRACIRAVKQAVGVPVFASGDAFSPGACRDILEETGADAVMIARGSLGDPAVFARCLALERGEPPREETLDGFLALMRRHVELTCLRKGENRAMPEIRKHALWYLKRLKGAKPYKLRIAQVSTLSGFDEICKQIAQAGLQVKP